MSAAASSGVGLNELKVFGTPAAVTAVPEPGTITLMGLGLAGLIGARRRKKKDSSG